MALSSAQSKYAFALLKSKALPFTEFAKQMRARYPTITNADLQVAYTGNRGWDNAPASVAKTVINTKPVTFK